MPAFPAATGSENAGYEPPVKPEQPKYFFQEKYAKLGVRGNFMPLAAQPKNVDLGDWLAHQGQQASVTVYDCSTDSFGL